MSKYFETVNFWLENLLDSVGNYTIESNEKGKYVDIVINVVTPAHSLRVIEILPLFEISTRF